LGEVPGFFFCHQKKAGKKGSGENKKDYRNVNNFPLHRSHNNDNVNPMNLKEIYAKIKR
jgi:hypothetical protein